MKKVYLDTDTILDLILERAPYFQSAALIFEMAERNDIILFTSSLCFANMFYILRKSYTSAQTIGILNKLIASINILPVDSKIIQSGLSSAFKDFEDSIQYYTAINNNMDFILTRNTKDYKVKDILVITADEFIKTI